MFTDNSSFIVLYTDSLENTREFYDKLKIRLIEEEENKLVYRIGDYELHFILSSSEVFENYKYVSNNPLGQGILMYIGSSELEKTFDVIQSSKPNNMTPIAANHWESREFLFEDPNGYKFAVYEDLEF
jgi:predicted enzyme related to lactoylglutathione lyase